MKFVQINPFHITSGSLTAKHQMNSQLLVLLIGTKVSATTLNMDKNSVNLALFQGLCQVPNVMVLKVSIIKLKMYTI